VQSSKSEESPSILRTRGPDFLAADVGHGQDVHVVSLADRGWRVPWATVLLVGTGFKPGTFFNTLSYNGWPIAADAGFTDRF
jgi:hypothetical protein